MFWERIEDEYRTEYKGHACSVYYVQGDSSILSTGWCWEDEEGWCGGGFADPDEAIEDAERTLKSWWG